MRGLLLCFFILYLNNLLGINGGIDSDIKKIPWQISILSADNSTIGGGAILGPNLVISAKHVFKGRDPYLMSIVAGESNQTDFNTKRRSIHRIISHEFMDVVLIELSEPLIFDDSTQAIDYKSSSDSEYYKEESSVITSGWGILDGSTAEILQEIEMKIISPEEARSLNKLPSTTISYYELPTIRFSPGIGGICSGDSGGPLVIWSESLEHYVLIGVANWSLGANCPTAPQHISVFTKVSYLIDWIDSHQIYTIGPENVRSIGSSYSVANKPMDSYVDWEYSSNLQETNRLDNSIALINTQYSYAEGSIQAIIRLGAREMRLPIINVSIDPKADIIIRMEGDSDKDGILTAEVVNINGLSYLWEYMNNHAYTKTIPEVKFRLLNNGINKIGASVFDGAEWVLLNKTFDIDYNIMDTVYLTPNPANSYINISLNRKEYTTTIKDMNLNIKHNIVMPVFFDLHKDLLYGRIKGTKSSIVIYNELGTLVKKINYDYELDNTQIEISDLSPGFYILNVLENGTRIVSRKFIIMH